MRPFDMTFWGMQMKLLDLSMGKVALVLAVTLLAACAGGRDQGVAKRIYSLHPESGPTPQSFVLCAGHGCRERHDVSLNKGEWSRVRAAFGDKPQNAAEERERIRYAVAQLETIVGNKTGTSADLAGTYTNMFASNQLDCADETVNTTTYIKMLIADGLVTRHRLGGRLHKGNIIDSLPHMTPTIIDQETGTQWAVDSWYLDNGALPEVVTASVWHTDYANWGSTGEPAKP